MGSTQKQTFLKRRHSGDTQVYETMFHTINHQEIHVKTSVSVASVKGQENRAGEKTNLHTAVRDGSYAQALWQTLDQPDPAIPIPYTHSKGASKRHLRSHHGDSMLSSHAVKTVNGSTHQGIMKRCTDTKRLSATARRKGVLSFAAPQMGWDNYVSE